MAIQPFDPSLYPALRSGPSGPITATPEASFVIRSSLAELVSLDDADFANGLNAYVVDEGEIYVLDTSNAFTVYSDLILARGAGSGRWFKRSKAYVVANYTLWYATRNVADGSRLFGFTPGQLVASSSSAPEIIVTLSVGTARAAQPLCDAYGNVWISSYLAATAWQVFKFNLADILAGGTVSPALTITGALSAGLASVIDLASSIAFDKGNNLWVAARNTATARGILQQIPQSALTNEGSYSVVPPLSLQGGGGVWYALDKTAIFDGNNNLWLSSYTGLASINKVPLSQRVVTDLAIVPSVVWSGANIVGPESIALGPTGLLWVSDYNSASIKAFDPQALTGNPTPIIVITSPGNIDGAFTISFDGDGNLWLLNFNNWRLLKFNKADILATGAPVPSVILSYAGLTPAANASFCFPNDPNRSGLLLSGAITKKGQSV
jgi:hypothetical protein